MRRFANSGRGWPEARRDGASCVSSGWRPVLEGEIRLPFRRSQRGQPGSPSAGGCLFPLGGSPQLVLLLRPRCPAPPAWAAGSTLRTSSETIWPEQLEKLSPLFPNKARAPARLSVGLSLWDSGISCPVDLLFALLKGQQGRHGGLGSERPPSPDLSSSGDRDIKALPPPLPPPPATCLRDLQSGGCGAPGGCCPPFLSTRGW